VVFLFVVFVLGIVVVALHEERDARRYRWLRHRDADRVDHTFSTEMIFIGLITGPGQQNLILTEEDADRHIDDAMAEGE
jgi:hypothetical protein